MVKEVISSENFRNKPRHTKILSQYKKSRYERKKLQLLPLPLIKKIQPQKLYDNYTVENEAKIKDNVKSFIKNFGRTKGKF